MSERLDYQQQQDDERRQLEDACPQHSARTMVDPGVCYKQCCAECLAAKYEDYGDHRDAYAGEPDNVMRGEHVYTRTTSGLYRNTSRDEPKGIWK